MWNFDEVKENEAFSLVSGIYEVKSTSAEKKTTQAGGEMIKLVFDVFDNTGKKLACKHFESYMVAHSNKVVVDIGMGNLKTLMKKAGRYPADGKFESDASLLKNLVGCPANVKIAVAEDERGNVNARIKMYKEPLVIKSDALPGAKPELPDDIKW